MAIMLLPNWGRLGVSAIPDVSWLSSSLNWTYVTGGQSFFEPAFNMQSWINNHSDQDTEKLIDVDSGTYLLVKKTNSSYGYYVEIYYGGTWIAGLQTSSSAVKDYIFFEFGIDETTQKGYFGIITARDGDPIQAAPIAGGQVVADYSKLYLFIMEAAPPTYNWRCVPAITGRKGTFNLSMINENFINNGDPVTSAPLSNIDTFAASSRIENLLDQMLADDVGQADFLFSGVVNALTITKFVPVLGAGLTNYSFYIIDTLKYQAGFDRLDGGEHFLCMLIDDENELARPSLITRNSGVVSYNQETGLDDTVMHELYIWLIAGADEEPQDDSTDNIDNEDDGADTWNPHQDIPIPGPDIPTKGAINTGFTSMYQITEANLRALSSFLWSDNFLNNVKKFFNDPREIIVGLTIMPIAGSIASTPQEIKAGGISTGVEGNKLNSQYHIVDMGSVPIDPETNTFLDYPSHTKVSAVLPYIGEVELDVNDIMGKRVGLKYVFDLLYGDLAAFLSVDGSAKYCFTGKAGVRIPTSSEDFSQVYAGGLQALGGIVSGIQSLASGNIGGILSASGNVVSALSQMHPTVQYQGGGSGSAGFVGNQRPFIKFDLTNPLLANTGNEEEEEPEAFRQRSFLGKTTYQNRKLSVTQCKGYTKCLKVHLVNIPCLDEELNEIEQQLLSGVIIQTGSTTPSGTPSTPGRFVITFLKSKSEHEVIGKKWSQAEADIKSLEGALLYDQSIITPKIIVEGDIRGFNYCYISEFRRFYYITDCIVRTGNIQEISLKVDVLQSFETQIKNCRAVVERQENHGNNYMQDSYMWAQNNRRIVTLPFMGGDAAYKDTSGAACFNRSNNTFILTIAGDN